MGGRFPGPRAASLLAQRFALASRIEPKVGPSALNPITIGGARFPRYVGGDTALTDRELLVNAHPSARFTRGDQRSPGK